MLGGTLFMDKSGERVSLMYLQFFNPISNGKKYSWGSATLSWLYRHLCNASKTAKQIGDALLLVQLWARNAQVAVPCYWCSWCSCGSTMLETLNQSSDHHKHSEFCRTCGGPCILRSSRHCLPCNKSHRLTVDRNHPHNSL
ncbi:serine/threonine-protein phosphatase 7 long form like protein [Quercus suber]|uniref:Serine/threonine-protein phosphatase 7 long form like protein n=1 Tax=Quercus suber TaxID=58331 RepID=A0AAW0LK17_QUESU